MFSYQKENDTIHLRVNVSFMDLGFSDVICSMTI